MKHFSALLIKYLFVAAACYVVLSGTPRTSGRSVLWIAAVLTIALYLLGDLLILPTMGNVTATLADAGVALLLTWLAPTYAAVSDVPFMAALYVAILIGVAEFFYHRYLQGSVLPGAMLDSGDD